MFVKVKQPSGLSPITLDVNNKMLPSVPTIRLTPLVYYKFADYFLDFI